MTWREKIISAAVYDDVVDDNLNDTSDDDCITDNNLKLVDDEVVCSEEKAGTNRKTNTC